MFAAIEANMPKFETKKALIITNMQNDTFEKREGLVVCEPQDFRDAIQKVVPYFRRMGDIIWVRTEFGGSDTQTASSSAPPPSSVGKVADDDNTDQTAKLTINELAEAEFSGRQIDAETLNGYFPSSRLKAQMRKATEKARADFREEEAEAYQSDEENDAYLKKPRKGKSATVYAPGTRGADFTADTLANIDEANDIILVKNHYSSFDATPLLVSLRMKLVTHIYLAGSLSNISIYATAADAVRHGFEVTVIEDCIGYRSEARHIDAMEKMADLLGVSGIDSDEIIEESGGKMPPDADPSLFTGPDVEGNRSRKDLQDPVSKTIRDHLRKTTLGAQALKKSRTPPATERRRSPEGSASPTDNAMEGVKQTTPTSILGPGDHIGEGDSQIIHNALSKSLAESAFKLLKDEIDWQVMRHRSGEVPRRVAVQGEHGNQGAEPLYRHPADETPPFQEFSTTVRKIRDEIQILLKQPFNHCLIQLYRSGQDNISEHADKTLDIVRGSSIANVSIGAKRHMTLRTKKITPPNHDQQQRPSAPASSRNSQRVPMPHNSIFVLGSRTNSKWLHGVRADKRPAHEKSDDEKSHGGVRISLTFRNIGTFTNRSRTRIWGQGAKSKFQATAGTITTANNAEMEAMITAFGRENHQVDFDWDAEYGAGFDVMNLIVTKAPSNTTLFLCGDELSNLRVKMAILERGVPCRMTRTKPVVNETTGRRTGAVRRTIFSLSGDENPMFRDSDANRSESVGDLAILFYINRFYPAEPDPGTVSAREMHRVASNVFARITQANELLFLWQELRGTPFNASTRATHQVRRLSVSPGAPLSTGSASSPAPTYSSVGSSSMVALTSGPGATPHMHTVHPAPPPSSSSHSGSGSGGTASHSLSDGTRPAEAFEGEMEVWEEYAEEAAYIGGEVFTIVDCGFWPVLNEVVRRWEGWSERRFPSLANYWRKVGAMEAVRRAVVEKGDERDDV